jgi:hypothetical protein
MINRWRLTLKKSEKNMKSSSVLLLDGLCLLILKKKRLNTKISNNKLLLFVNSLCDKIKILIKKKFFPSKKTQTCLDSNKSMIIIFHEQTRFMNFKMKKTTNPIITDSYIIFTFGFFLLSFKIKVIMRLLMLKKEKCIYFIDFLDKKSINKG